eukprot:2428346-Rhodomonas_salina.1
MSKKGFVWGRRESTGTRKEGEREERRRGITWSIIPHCCASASRGTRRKAKRRCAERKEILRLDRQQSADRGVLVSVDEVITDAD